MRRPISDPVFAALTRQKQIGVSDTIKVAQAVPLQASAARSHHLSAVIR